MHLEFKETETKTYFGPLMAPDLFATRWHCKTRSFLFRKVFKPPINTDSTWVFELVEGGRAHIKAWSFQLAQHGFTGNDFDDFDPEASDEPPPFDITSAEEIKFIHRNPFIGPPVIAGFVEAALRRLEDVRLGGTLYGQSWEDIPKSLRDKVGFGLWEVEDFKEQGKWPMTEEQSAVTRKFFEKVASFHGAARGTSFAT